MIRWKGSFSVCVGYAERGFALRALPPTGALVFSCKSLEAFCAYAEIGYESISLFLLYGIIVFAMVMLFLCAISNNLSPIQSLYSPKIIQLNIQTSHMPQGTKPKAEFLDSEMEHFESLRNGINNPPPPTSMSQQSKASDTTADTNDMANLREVIPGSQQQPPGSQSQQSDDINDAMFSQNSIDSDQYDQEDRDARRLKWREQEQRSAAQSDQIEKIRAAAWSEIEDSPTNNNSTPSWADRISGVSKDVLVGNTNTTTTTGDLGDLTSPPQKNNIQNVNDKMASLIGSNNSPKDEEDPSPSWAPINSSEEQSTTEPPSYPTNYQLATIMANKLFDNDDGDGINNNNNNDDRNDLYEPEVNYNNDDDPYGPTGGIYNRSRYDDPYGTGGLYDNSTRDEIDPSQPLGKDKILSMFDNSDDTNSSVSSGLPGESPLGDNLVSYGDRKTGGIKLLCASRLYINLTYPSF